MPLRPLTRDEARSIDQRAMDEYGIPGVVLMENAGRNAARIIADRYAGLNRPVCVVCGKGNNAGDGFVIARVLAATGYMPTVIRTSDPEALSNDARFNFGLLRNSGIECVALGIDRPDDLAGRLNGYDIIVDALIGTGLRGSLGGRLAEIARCINDAKANRSDSKVVSIDIPSGLDCDLGTAGDANQPTCVKADLTITFVAKKIGFDNPIAAEFLGEVVVAEIGAPEALLRDYQI